MDAMIRDFSLYLAAEGKKPHTITIYTKAAIWLQREQGITDWTSVSKSAIRNHMSMLNARYSPAYASNQFRALSQFFKYLENEEDIRNPMRGMKGPTVPEKLVPVIDKSYYAKLIGSISGKRFNDYRDRAILEFFRSTGARRAEVAGLRVNDIDLDQLAAVVTGKGSKMRIVRFDAQTGLALSRYLRMRKKHKYSYCESLWIGKFGPMFPDGIYLVIKRRSRAAGEHINPHRFRHDFSHRYLLNGGQEGDLMIQNGWSDPKMVRRYGSSAAAQRAREHYDSVMK